MADRPRWKGLERSQWENTETATPRHVHSKTVENQGQKILNSGREERASPAAESPVRPRECHCLRPPEGQATRPSTATRRQEEPLQPRPELHVGFAVRLRRKRRGRRSSRCRRHTRQPGAQSCLRAAGTGKEEANELPRLPVRTTQPPTLTARITETEARLKEQT